MIRRIVRNPRAGRLFAFRADRLTDERVNVRLPASTRFMQQYRLFAGQVH